MMTYPEVSAVLRRAAISWGQHVYEVQGMGELDATALYLPPVRWFVAVAGFGTLSTGTYVPLGGGVGLGGVGKMRLAGEQQIPFADLTEQALADKIGEALARQIELELMSFDPEAECWPPPPPRWTA